MTTHRDKAGMGEWREESISENIARDMREGRFPERSPPALVRVTEAVEDVLTDILGGREHRCGPVNATPDQFTRLTAAFEARDAEQAQRMPDDAAALRQMFDAYDRLKKLGWNDAIYCPKDGTVFEAIEAGSSGIHDCHYEGEWPNGSWWAHDNGDLWPSRPILFRLKKPPTQDGGD